MTTIPIILASDNNYAPYMSVLMISILKNAKSNPFIDFYLLVPESFKEKYKKTIQADCRFYKNKHINFIDMQNAFSQTKRMIAHITEQSYYRLKATEILPKEYDKCIYLDIDTIVNDDLSELFSIDIEDNYVAGVKAPGYHFPEDGNRKYCERIGIPSINQYINSGVMLLNLKKIREDNLTPTLCEEALGPLAQGLPGESPAGGITTTHHPEHGTAVPKDWAHRTQSLGTLYPRFGKTVPKAWEDYTQGLGT